MNLHTDQYRPDSPRPARRVLLAVCMAGAMLPATLLAAPVLRCQIDQGGITRMLDVTPTDDPYRVKAIDINGRFRFKAVMIGDARQVEYIKLYTYDQAMRQPALLHMATYLTPAVSVPPASLTGRNFVYAPDLERELQYQCTLLEVTP